MKHALKLTTLEDQVRAAWDKGKGDSLAAYELLNERLTPELKARWRAAKCLIRAVEPLHDPREVWRRASKRNDILFAREWDRRERLCQA